MSTEDVSCQACELGLLGFKKLTETPFVVSAIKSFFSDTLCPKLVSNTSLCVSGTEIIGGALLETIHEAILDPQYFCEQTIHMCKQGNYQYYHAEAYVNSILRDKPDIAKTNDYLNKLYSKIKGQKRRTLRVV
jgi:hypothetical protein